MSHPSTPILSDYLQYQLTWLTVLREYKAQFDDPHVNLALSFIIEDCQEAIARVSSRLRQLEAIPTKQLADQKPHAILWKSRQQTKLIDKLRFVRFELQDQLTWYDNQVKKLSHDPDSQAVLVALAEQVKLRLARWEDMMTEMKVSLEG